MECDQQGVVFNAHYLTWADEASNVWWAAHGLPWDKRMSASLDHAVWIHRPIARGSFMLDDRWMLYASQSPVGHAARSLIFGGLYSSDGVRFASVVQEGLIRPLARQ